MDKLSAEKVAEVLSQVSPALRALSEENSGLKEKVAHYELMERAEKLAGVMEEKGLDSQISHDEKVQRLMKTEDLDVVEKAVDLSAPQFKLAHVSDNPGNHSDALSALEAAILE